MKAECLLCRDVLEATVDKPDTCKCGKSFMDIGHDYFNSGGFLKVIIEK